jgi:hypothetical protein
MVFFLPNFDFYLESWLSWQHQQETEEWQQ